METQRDDRRKADMLEVVVRKKVRKKSALASMEILCLVQLMIQKARRSKGEILSKDIR